VAGELGIGTTIITCDSFVVYLTIPHKLNATKIHAVTVWATATLFHAALASSLVLLPASLKLSIPLHFGQPSSFRLPFHQFRVARTGFSRFSVAIPVGIIAYLGPADRNGGMA